MKYKVSIIGGCGHIGAPLGVLLAENGYDVCLIDTNLSAIKTINRGVLPFIEKSSEGRLATVLEDSRLVASSSYEMIEDSEVVIVAIGTNTDEYGNPLTDQFLSVISEIALHAKNVLLVIRSTVPVGMSDLVHKVYSSSNAFKAICFCPERIVQGQSFVELPILPQIISASDRSALPALRELFGFTRKCIELSLREAEFSKLMCNSYRYMQFAISNQLFMAANDLGVNFNRVATKVRENYHRLSDLPSPGFTGGPCLRKDMLQLRSSNLGNFSFGNSAVEINEGMPAYISRVLAGSLDLAGAEIIILGMAFKAESDDIRDSLSFKLKKILFSLGAKVVCHDPYVIKDGVLNQVPISLEDYDAAVVAAPHRQYDDLKFPKSVKVVNIWKD